MFHRFAYFDVRTRTEAGERDDAELDAVNGLGGRFDDRLGDDCACELDVTDPAATRVFGGQRFDPELDVGAGQPLDQRDGGFDGGAGELAPVDGDDQIAGLQPRAGGGRGVEDAHDQQPAVGDELRGDGHADAGEVRRGAEFAEFAGAEVVREAVVEALDETGERSVVELARGDRSVVVVRNALDRFVDDARLRARNERAAQETGQVFGVPAQPQAHDEQHGQQQREREAQR